MNRRQFLGAALLAASPAPSAGAPQKPKVRALTAFLKLDRDHYQPQIQETLAMLRQARRAIQAGGYEVETLRIVTQPFPEYCRGLSRQETLRFFRDYDALAAREGFRPNIGPAMLRDDGDPEQAALLGEILASTKTIIASLVIAGAGGIYWRAIRAAARLVKFLEDNTPGGAGNFSFAATAMLSPYAPFYPGAYHLEDGRRFAIGTEGANVVDEVFGGATGNAPLAAEQLTQALATHAAALERLARQVEKESGWTYMGIDPTPAPLRDISIGAAIEHFTGAKFGSSGTMTAAAIITKAVQSAPVKLIGYAGLMLPVLEDTRLAQRWSEGTYDVDALLAYSAVCGTGLDTIPMPGDTPAEQIERILGDVASLAVKWKKPLTARLMPVKGLKPGDRTTFNDPSLVNAVIRPIR